MERRPRDQAKDDDGGDDLAARLPDDVIGDVLRRLAPRWLAASRCVCKAWRAVVDTRGLLRADLLPLSLAGIFIDFENKGAFSEFFSRPATTAITGNVDFLPLPADIISRGIGYYGNEFVVQDHCNGLVLIKRYVINPATQRWDPLPDPPPDNHYKEMVFFFDKYLVFDPMVSPHYEVIMVPCWCSNRSLMDEWPPSPCVMRVFSSRSGRWEERSFVRQENAAAETIALELRNSSSRLFSAYWRGSLYVPNKKRIMRISLSEDKYSVIPLPVTTTGDRSYRSPYLGRSEKGVYFAAIGKDGLHVWILNESCGGNTTEWIMKGVYSIKPLLSFNRQVHGPWILQNNNSSFYRDLLPETNNDKEGRKATTIIGDEEELMEWNSDDDDDFPADRGDDRHHVECRYGYCCDIEMLGFHPYKEIMFLCTSGGLKAMAMGLAYHLNSSRVQALGSMYPTHYEHFDIGLGLVNEDRSLGYTFPYTPCWIGGPPARDQ